MKPFKILVIDDEAQDQKGITVALEKGGYKDIACRQTGEEGIEAAIDLNPDIVITDVVLPGINGIEVCKQIKIAAGIPTKVIIITGHLEAVDADQARISGADEIIEKTPGFNNVLQTIDRLTNSKLD